MQKYKKILNIVINVDSEIYIRGLFISYHFVLSLIYTNFARSGRL